MGYFSLNRPLRTCNGQPVDDTGCLLHLNELLTAMEDRKGWANESEGTDVTP